MHRRSGSADDCWASAKLGWSPSVQAARATVNTEAGTGNSQILLIVGEVPGDILVIYSFSSEFQNCISVKGSLFASNVGNLTKTVFKKKPCISNGRGTLELVTHFLKRSGSFLIYLQIFLRHPNSY